MAHLIDKDALVAEIEKLKVEALQKKNQCKRSGLERIMHQIGAYNKILSFIGTLEVKEVDLEKELEDWLGERVGKWTGKECERMCRYFFELGLKTKQS